MEQSAPHSRPYASYLGAPPCRDPCFSRALLVLGVLSLSSLLLCSMKPHTVHLPLPLLPLCSQEPATSLFQFVREERSMFVHSEGLSSKGTAQPVMRPHTLHGSCLFWLAE